MVLLFTTCFSGPLLSQPNHMASPRVWVPDLTIQSIELTHSTNEPTDVGEYINKTHEVIITLENTGSVVLNNLIISYRVLRGVLTDFAGSDTSKNKLLISEIYDSKFDWTPSIGQGTKYKIEVSVNADNFGTPFGPITDDKEFIINDVKKDVGPVDYYFDPPAASLGGEISNSSHTLTTKVRNFGNFQLTGGFSVSATIYSESTGQQLWTDSSLHSSPLAASGVTEISFTTPWLPPTIGLYRLNMSTTLSGDIRPNNDNITVPPILIGDVRDVAASKINNFVHNSIHHSDPITVSARIENSGNLNITTPFSAALYVNSYPDGANLFAPAPIPVPVTGPSNISAPHSYFDAVFNTWDFANGLKEGKVWINISIDPNENNGSSFNNNLSIVIELKNWTNVQLEFLLPQSGAYHAEDITEVVVNISNLGTENLPPYIINLTLHNEFSNETWINYTGHEEVSGLSIGNYKIHSFSDWDITYDSKFDLMATLAWSSAPGITFTSVSKVFEIKGGEVNGTITGVVNGAAEGHGLENISIKIYLPFVPDPILTTTTDATGSFSASLEAVPGGRVFSIVISESDNYWWAEAKQSVEVFSGRESTTSITLNRLASGRITGKVLLASLPGTPELIAEWTGITILVEGTPISFSTDAQGNFDTELVAGVINITVTKNNFKETREEYVIIIPSQTTSVELTLYEDWAVGLAPANNELEVPPDTTITAIFNAELDVNSVKPNTLGIFDIRGKLLPGISMENYIFYKDDTYCRITPPKQLAYNTTYKIKITTAVKFNDGTSALHRNWESEFTTEIGEGTLEGYCTYYWSKMPLENVEINLSGQVEYNIATNDNGLYIIENIPAGNYQIKVTLSGNLPIIENMEILPGRILWLNFTFDDGLPVPRLWANNLLGKKVLIDENLTDRIRVDTEFTLTSNIPLEPASVNGNTIKIIEKETLEEIVYKNVIWSQNRLSFIFETKNDLNYNTSFEIIYKKNILTFDGRQIFQNDWNYGNFTTDAYKWRPLTAPNINPVNGAVNVPINHTITIDFPVPMNITSVESLINTSFQITAYGWYGKNTTIAILHERFEYFTEYEIILMTGMTSGDGFYRLMAPIKVSFTTLPGLARHVIGPVIDKEGKIIDGVGMNIYNSTGAVIKSSVTNSTGYAIFYFESVLEPGEYSLELIKPGYDIITWEFTVNETGELIFSGSLPKMKKKGEAEDTSWWFIGGIIIAVILIIILGIIGFIILIGLKPKKPKPEGEPEPLKEPDKGAKAIPEKLKPESKPTKQQDTKATPTTLSSTPTVPGTGKGFSIIERSKPGDKNNKGESVKTSKDEKPSSSQKLLDKVRDNAQKESKGTDK